MARRALISTGDVLEGRFEVGRRIGEGGFGQVFEGVDTARGGRPVAIKVIAGSAQEEPELLARLEREAFSAELARHRHVLPLLYSGEHQDNLYLVMPLADTDLEALVEEEGPLAPARAVRICAQVALALDHAHASKVIHRDVKPQNVLIDLDPSVGDHSYLADFGIAKALVAKTLTRTGFASPFSPAYGAPEQFRALADPSVRIGPAVDQFALACLFIYCLSGRPPFGSQGFGDGGLSAETRLGDALGRVPASVRPVLRRALAVDPEARFASCAQCMKTVSDSLAAAERQERDRRPEPPVQAAPMCQVAPSLRGAPVVGQTLVVDPGSWSLGPGDALGFTWFRVSLDAAGRAPAARPASGSRTPGGGGRAPIRGANQPTHLLTAADAGMLIEVQVTAQGPGGSARASSPAAGPVRGAAPPPLLPVPLPPGGAGRKLPRSAIAAIAVGAIVTVVAVATGATIGGGFPSGPGTTTHTISLPPIPPPIDPGFDPGTTDIPTSPVPDPSTTRVSSTQAEATALTTAANVNVIGTPSCSKAGSRWRCRVTDTTSGCSVTITVPRVGFPEGTVKSGPSGPGC